jgi:hypothetical protein
VNGRPLCYLDNAASSQHPRSVIDAISRYYETSHANVHRGVHTLSQEASDLFEGAREKLRRFVNARSTKEIVFVRGTTEAINLVAQSYARPRLQPGDEILISWLEHHANIVPWQMLCEQTGAVLRALVRLMNDGKVKKPLIVAPLRVAEDTWPDEIATWDFSRHLTYRVVTGDLEQRIAALEYPADVTIINRENIGFHCYIDTGLVANFNFEVFHPYKTENKCFGIYRNIQVVLAIQICYSSKCSSLNHYRDSGN